MRLWNPLSRPTRAAPAGRCFLVVEQLETRDNRAPMVLGPADPGIISEGMSRTFGLSNSFSVSDTDNAGQVYTVVLTADHGVITFSAAALSQPSLLPPPPPVVTSPPTNGIENGEMPGEFPPGDGTGSGPDPDPSPGLIVLNNGTSAVTLTGTLEDINAVLGFDSAFTFGAEAFYSGDATLALTATDGSDNESDSASVAVRVNPVASPATLTVNGSGERRATTADGFSFSGTLTAGAWSDLDGSEALSVVLKLDPANDPTAFTLVGRTGTVPLQSDGDGGFFWRVSADDPAAAQAELDALTLVPPAGFTGRASLTVAASLTDTATFATDPTTLSDTNFDVGAGTIDLRFYQGTSVAFGPVPAALPGATVDLGGRFVGSDPDLLSGDVSEFAFSVPSGALAFDTTAAEAAGVSGVVRDNGGGGNTVVLTGSLEALNAFLARPNSLVYAGPSATFAGTVRVSVTLSNRTDQAFDPPAPGAFSGSVNVTFVAPGGPPPGGGGSQPEPEPEPEPEPTPEPQPEPEPEPQPDPGPDPDPGPSGEPQPDTNGGGSDPDAADPDDDGDTGDDDEAQVAPDPDTPDGVSEDDSDPGDDPAFSFVIDLGDLDDLDDADADADDAGVTEDELSEEAEGLAEEDPEEDDGDDRPSEMTTRPAVLPEAFASSIPLSVWVGDGRMGLAAAGLGSLFANPEPPQPAYGAADRHPLPPVLPLDHSTAAAGFTESGGDNFALIDALLRGQPLAAETAAQAPAPAAKGEPVVVPPAAPQPPAPPPPGEEAGEGGWPFWAGGVLISLAATAWAVLSFDRNGRLARWARRLFHSHGPAHA